MGVASERKNESINFKISSNNPRPQLPVLEEIAPLNNGDYDIPMENEEISPLNVDIPQDEKV